MAEVFVSYCRENSAPVERLIAAVRRYGIAVSYDQLFEHAQNFRLRIRKEIKTAKAVVVCWSNEAAQSDWVNEEALEARAQGKYLGCQIAHGDVGLGFRSFNHDDLTRWQGNERDMAFLQFMSRIGSMIDRDEIAGLEEAERARLAAEKRSQEAIEFAKRRERAIEAAKAAAVAAMKKQRKEEAERQFMQLLPSLEVLYWLNPLILAVVFLPSAVLWLYPLALLFRLLAALDHENDDGWSRFFILVSWLFALVGFWSAASLEIQCQAAPFPGAICGFGFR